MGRTFTYGPEAQLSLPVDPVPWTRRTTPPFEPLDPLGVPLGHTMAPWSVLVGVEKGASATARFSAGYGLYQVSQQWKLAGLGDLTRADVRQAEARRAILAKRSMLAGR